MQNLHRSLVLVIWFGASLNDIYGSSPGVVQFQPDPEVRQLVGSYDFQACNGQVLTTYRLGTRSPASDGEILLGIANEGTFNPASEQSFTSGSAWIYEKYARGTMSNFTYGNPVDERELQEAIWFIEDVRDLSNPLANRYVSQAVRQFGSVAEARKPYSGDSVRIIDLVSPSALSSASGGEIILGQGDGMSISSRSYGFSGKSYVRGKEFVGKEFVHKGYLPAIPREQALLLAGPGGIAPLAAAAVGAPYAAGGGGGGGGGGGPTGSVSSPNPAPGPGVPVPGPSPTPAMVTPTPSPRPSPSPGPSSTPRPRPSPTATPGPMPTPTPSPVPVPEGGSSILLLMLGLAGLGAVRRLASR